jgi:hypothetical protein
LASVAADYLVSAMTPPTTLTRRSLLRMGALATSAALGGLRPWDVAAAEAAASHLRRSSWSRLLGRRFAVGTVELKLLSVTNVAGAAVNASLAGSDDAFVLSFSGPLTPVLRAGTYTLQNPRLGRFELFVSPVGRPGKDQRYEAVIDRSVRVPKSPPGRPARDS